MLNNRLLLGGSVLPKGLYVKGSLRVASPQHIYINLPGQSPIEVPLATTTPHDATFVPTFLCGMYDLTSAYWGKGIYIETVTGGKIYNADYRVIYGDINLKYFNFSDYSFTFGTGYIPPLMDTDNARVEVILNIR